MVIQDILDWLDDSGYAYNVSGDRNRGVDGFSSLANYRPGTLTWVGKESCYADCGRPENLQCAVVQENIQVKSGCTIVTPASREVFFAILKHFWGEAPRKCGTGRGTVFSGNVRIPPSVSVGDGCVLSGDICVGGGTVIEDHVTIMNRVTIGRNCIIHSGTVIGKDGFGFTFGRNGIPVKVAHFGGVLIGDRVEIGANTVIDRGTLDNTCIGDDSKIDSLCLIAHNVQIGKAVLVAGKAEVAGSARIGDRSYIAPGGMVKNQVKTGTGCFIGMGVTVRRDMADDTAAVSGDGKMIKIRDYRRFL